MGSPSASRIVTDTPLIKFQRLLRELFQFDCADLDFGIYRILNHKRDVIRRFIEEDLPKQVGEELSRGQVAEQAAAAAEQEKLAGEVRTAFGAGALDADGELESRFLDFPLGQKYVEAREAASGARSGGAMEAETYNHLYRFFRRYYEDGDFISKRRYSKDHRYAVPYDGEEVLLHWATADQYYVKSAEHFRDYQFQSRTGVIVRFDLRKADVEHDNVKGDRRFFIAGDSETAWDPEARRLVVPFEYRPLAASEQTRYGAKQAATAQSRLLDQASAAIRNAASDHPECLAALDEFRRVGADGKTQTLLEYHLRHYTRRNTSDFFIHKDLSGFLTRELDFYIKNEVLSLDTLHVGGEERAEGWFQMMRLLRSIGGRIITFLGQIEDFQKMLWEKRKFVVETNYIVTVGHVSEDL
jgi:adenine-specific DNA-methyltransferase